MVFVIKRLSKSEKRREARSDTPGFIGFSVIAEVYCCKYVPFAKTFCYQKFSYQIILRWPSG